jgi:hypothetical protein
MHSARIIERIENGELKFQEEIDGVQVHVDIEEADKLGLLLKRLQLETSRVPQDVPAALRKQSTAIVERLSFLEALRVLEIDGISHAVQIRSEKPSEDGFIEIILRKGNSVSFERRGKPLHISKPHFERLIEILAIS